MDWIADISIHAPREGSDGVNLMQGLSIGIFLSTLPARGATCQVFLLPPSSIFLSTLPARGATGVAIGAAEHRVISIHAPREGSDTLTQEIDTYEDLFLSTLPARGATA